MRILLTGTSGQLGHALLSHLPRLPATTIVLAPQRAELDLSNATQLRQCITDFKPDLIINPAAYTAVDLAESEAEKANAINAIAPAIMAEEARKLGAGLIHYSTDYVFSGDKSDAEGNWQAYTEADATGPLNVYGKTKLAGEQAIVASGCQHLILRTSWVYSNFGKNFFLTMLKLARERDQLRVVNDQWGTPNSADWLAAATCEILAQLQQAQDAAAWWQQFGGVYHFSASGKTNWFAFASAIIELADQQNKLGKAAPQISGIPASEYPVPARRPHNSLLSTEKLQAAFGLSIPDWRITLDACMQGVQLSVSEPLHLTTQAQGQAK
ncbi:MAG: dTDP-4-dehydrorhamnose reductase [Undibacterium umbellatum]|uniref:dTDP-4-dehydrorhamnose reductase n=1 Tax=Undibacterium umbellatum TaxID=2762300 RepID=UPI003BB4A9C1